MGSSRSCQPTGPTPYPLMFASPHFLVAKNLIAAQIYLLQHQLLQCQKMEDGCLQSQFGNTFLLKNEWRISPKFDLVKCNRQQGLSLVDFLKHGFSNLAVQLKFESPSSHLIQFRSLVIRCSAGPSPRQVRPLPWSSYCRGPHLFKKKK
ncbi:uncharacterized protein LOC111389182 isoform X1 [Olea europaea var. sylvestris]|uniref:uncharacterized protein LOC111389182 isoform X1 n=1 Tax=Olea europaea var. sylvestris TaxID=158386 RepID=UPI000C1CF62E|nr:uncharacterized protein LOC111389182 isoform X1 [Olea europaea var. sylvestris]